MVKKMKQLSDKKKLRLFFDNVNAECRIAAPICRHFGECGGCEFQDVPYPAQLAAKRKAFDFIADAVIREYHAKAAAVNPEAPEDAAAASQAAASLEAMLAGREIAVEASPQQFGYRQRMDYVYAFGKAGLRRVNRHRQVVELTECPLLGATAFAVFQKALALIQAAGLESYDYIRHTGELRYFVIRQSRTGQILLSLISKSREPEQKIMAILQKLVTDGDITSGHWLLADGLGDVSFGESLAHAGCPWIVETMNNVTLRIGPNTFFQSNPAVAEKAYAAIRAFCPPGGIALDTYSGVGSIALSLASGVEQVIAVENVLENILLAKANLNENPVTNVDLINADSVAYLLNLAGNPDQRKPDLLVVNPPRPGVEGAGMAAIRNLAPARIAYLSCNPFTLLRNLAAIAGEYSLRSLTIYDMFPQTRHFESLALLYRNDF